MDWSPGIWCMTAFDGCFNFQISGALSLGDDFKALEATEGHSMIESISGKWLSVSKVCDSIWELNCRRLEYLGSCHYDGYCHLPTLLKKGIRNSERYFHFDSPWALVDYKRYTTDIEKGRFEPEKRINSFTQSFRSGDRCSIVRIGNCGRCNGINVCTNQDTAD